MPKREWDFTLLDGLEDAVAVVEQGGKVVHLNPAAERALGVSNEALRGCSFSAHGAANGWRRLMSADSVEFFAKEEAREPDRSLALGVRVGQCLERNRSHALLRQLPAAIAILRGPELRYEVSNALNREYAGGRDLIGKTVVEAMHELEAQGLAELVEGVYRSGIPFVGQELPVEVRQTDGSTRLLFLNGAYHPLFDNSGNISGVLAFAYDVTQQAQARQQVEDAQRSLALIADSVPQMIWATRASDGKVEFFNRRWYEYTGLTEAESAQATWQRVCHLDDLPRILNTWAEALQKDEPFEAEVRMLRASDHTYRWHLARSLPLRNAKGEIVKWIGSATDIDDHKRSEESSRFLSEASAALGASLDYEATLKSFAALIVPRFADWCSVFLKQPDEDTARQIVVAHRDPDKVKWAVEMNARFPPHADEPAGLYAVIRNGQSELYPEIDDALLAKAARSPEHLATMRELGMKSVMIVPLIARGRTFGALLMVSTSPLRRYAERDLGLARELAERAAAAVDNARLYNSAQEAIRIRDDFLSVASHELKTPLTPLQINVQSIQRAARHGEAAAQSPLPRFAEKLDTIGKQVGRLDRLINSLLDVSRITGDRLELDLEDVDLAVAAREVVERFREQALQSNIELSFQGPQSLMGRWDRLRIDQIAVNLVSNALKFGHGKPVEVGVSGDINNALLTVKDFGIGIAQKDQERIFGRFERAVPSRHYGGMGLGLWLTRQLILAMHGTIQVASAPGEGSLFTVTLPRNVD